jgi:hypothetical protein
MQALEAARLGRNGAHPAQDLVLAETLAKLEASGLICDLAHEKCPTPQ